MRNIIGWWIFTIILTIWVSERNVSALSEEEMTNKLVQHNGEAEILCNILRRAMWNVSTDIGNARKETERLRRSIEYSQFEKKQWENTWRDANISNYSDENVRRQLFFLQQLGVSALNPNELGLLVRTITTMTRVYNTAKICPFNNQNCNITAEGLALDSDITNLMGDSRNYDELLYTWLAWHNNTGKLMWENYKRYVPLLNQAGKENSLADAKQMWQAKYEEPNFEDKIDQLWEEVESLYDELHTYIKYRLRYIYGRKINITEKLIPAHLFGNMWAQKWDRLYHDTKPFKNASLVDVTHRLKALDYSPKKMFEIANDFYISLGLPSNEVSFNPPAIIERPLDRSIECQASAWDFCDGKDFRIKMCTKTNKDDFETIHHEMGHIQYFIQYKNLPYTFRNGANPGFHEAIGETIALAASTPNHLSKIGLVENYSDSYEDNINFLFHEALERIAFLPFGLLVDKWRWDVFSGKVPETQWNEHWWKLREKYQKVKMPVKRSEEDFDPGSLYHVPSSQQYISHFVADILQFQIYKSLCVEAGQHDPLDSSNKPLHKCNFHGSKKAGEKLSNGMKLGSSKHWSEVLQQITGEKELRTEPLIEYFHPLREFLKRENPRLKLEWETREKLEDYDVVATEQCNKLQIAEWNFITDINNKTKQEIRAQAIIENAKFQVDEYNKHFRHLKLEQFEDNSIKRQLLYISKLGVNKLEESKLNEWSNLKSKMENTYNNAVFCPYSKQQCDLSTEAVSFDPEIVNIMAKSSDFHELKYTWVNWFNHAGAPMREDFKKYVRLSNEAAKLNGFDDYGQFWRSMYEDPKFIENILEIWKQVEPLYNRLHEYTRYQLLQIYGEKMDENDPLIPAHLLGNIWSQTWVNLYDRIRPFKEASDFDITRKLQELNYTALKMFKEADKFYQSLNLEPMQMSYMPPAIIEKPTDRLIVCHASAWDFCDGKDFRIKQCTTVNQRNFVTIHHEMGHIQYYILYKDQPAIFRRGANPGFHEAVGDLIALSVSTPGHLRKINLLNDYEDTYENNINSLFRMALERVAFLPFGLLVDLYRWDIFSEKVPESKWSAHWDELRATYQKIRSPVERTEENFDAGGKYHVPADYPYIAYFFAHILEFQLHRSLCLEANEYEPNNPEKPLHKCDIGGTYYLGQRIRAGLEKGLSLHWSETLKILTNGETQLSADALLEYFKPLDTFLLNENYRLRTLNSSFGYIPVAIGAVIGGVLIIAIASYFIYVANRGSTKPK